MTKTLTIAALTLLFFPASVLAAVPGPSAFFADRSLLVASSSPGNEYAAGASVVVAAPVAGDLSAFGGTVAVAAPVEGDELLVAGSASSRANISGDLRALGGDLTIEGPVEGDLVAAGLSVNAENRVKGSVFIAALDVAMTGSVAGPVTIYANSVSLGGDFAGDVTVVASGHVSVAPGTVIHGTLSYDAPDAAAIPDSASITQVEYRHSGYLPDSSTSRVLAALSASLFLLVRILGMLILAGLFAGLFPRLADRLVERTVAARPRSLLLTFLLGFAVLVATPILLLVLALTFVGFGIASLLALCYLLVGFLAVLYAGILLGTLFARRYAHRRMILWRDGVLGMLALSLLALIPIIGVAVAFALTVYCLGALLTIFFDFAFLHEGHS